MGYYYNLTNNQSVFVPVEKIPALNEQSRVVLEKEHIDPVPEGVTPFEHLAGQDHWSVHYDGLDNMTGLSHGESKHINDGILQVVAPFADNGGYVEVKGEDDDDLFRWVFIDGDVVTINPVIIWDMDLDHLRQQSANEKAVTTRLMDNE